jgi:predicted RNA-binding Zn-ribbon protein involved in translation (DUF1610 family)
MQVICPNCAHQLGDDKVGRVYRCRHCGEVFRVGEDLPKPDNDNLEIEDSHPSIDLPSTPKEKVTESLDMGGGPETNQSKVQSLSQTIFPSSDQDEADLNEKPSADSGASEEQGKSQFVVKCPKCGERHNPGILRCAKCNTCLRPTFLGVITLIGPIFLILLALMSLFQITKNPFEVVVFSINLVSFSINVVGIFTLLGLRAGKYWAWIAIQVIWVINIIFSTTLAILINPILFVNTAVQGLIIFTLWLYMDSKKVKAFCSVGRPRSIQ